MSFIQKIKAFFRNFRSKFRLSLRDPHDDREVWYLYLSPLSLLMAFVSVLLVLFTLISLTIAYTNVTAYIPGYPGNDTRRELIASTMRLDSLERRLVLWDNYYANIARIMDGRPPLPTDGNMSVDTVSAAGADIPRIPEDSVLRAQMESEGIYQLQPTPSGSRAYIDLYPPLKGVVTKSFDPRSGQLGTDISSADNQPIMSVMDGTVIYAGWSPAQGHAVYILHAGNIVSAYIHTARLNKGVGDRVYSGEVIAFTGVSSETAADRGYIQFQLWINGNPVDPENYVLF